MHRRRQEFFFATGLFQIAAEAVFTERNLYGKTSRRFIILLKEPEGGQELPSS